MSISAKTITVERDGQKRTIGRIVGGISWPGNVPGHVVVLVEEKLAEAGPIGGSDTYHCHLIGEAAELDLHRLIQSCLDLARNFFCPEFFALKDDASEAYLTELQRERKEIIRVSRTKHVGNDLSYYLNLMRNSMQPGQVSLHVPTDSQVANELKSAQRATDAKSEDFPALTAFGYPFNFLRTFKPVDEKPPESKPKGYM